MFFTKGPFIYRRLKKLADYGLIVRIQREVVGKASELVHALVPEGARHLGLRLGVPASTFTVHRKAGRQFLEHELALNEFRLAFERAVHLHQAGLAIEQWDRRRKLRVPGRKTLIPDAYVTLLTPKGKTHFFVELDRFTESVSRVFRNKLETYAAYHKSGNFIRESGAKFFRVLTITVHEHAVSTLLAASQNIAPQAIFWFTHQALVETDSVLSGPIWKRADQPETFSSLYTRP